MSAFDNTYGLSFRQLVRALDPRCDFDQFLTAYVDYVAANPADLLPGVTAFISALRERGVSVGIVSSSDSRLIAAELRAYGLESVFEVILGTDGPGLKKPNPHALRAAAWTLTGSEGGRERLYIGDAIGDWRLARGAGFGFRAVCTGVVTCDEFVSAGVDPMHVAPDLTAIEVVP